MKKLLEEVLDFIDSMASQLFYYRTSHREDGSYLDRVYPCAMECLEYDVLKKLENNSLPFIASMRLYTHACNDYSVMRSYFRGADKIGSQEARMFAPKAKGN